MSDKRSPGQPAYDDAEALKEVRRIRAAHPKWTRTRAALHYAASHPEEKASPYSIARRLADKLRRQDGITPGRRSTRRRLLEELTRALWRAIQIVDNLAKLEDEK